MSFHEVVQASPIREDNLVCGDLCDVFTSQFITRKKHPTMMVVLSGITQGNKESLWEYINRSSKVDVKVRGGEGALKCYITKKS